MTELTYPSQARPGNVNGRRHGLYSVVKHGHPVNRRVTFLMNKVHKVMPWLQDSDSSAVRSWAELSVLLNAPSIAFPDFLALLGGADLFDEDFTAQMNIQLQAHTPEPGTGLMVALGLCILAARRRRPAHG